MNGGLISVIIPYFNEQPNNIFPLLASLNGQVGTGIYECILVNDGNRNILPPVFTGLFKNLTIRCVLLNENKGAGVARQAGTDCARGDYVMYCDADDTLQNVSVINAFTEVINRYRPDMIGSRWYAEYPDAVTGETHYRLFDGENTWLFGKAFKRAFLIEKGIRFHERLHVHEDTYFLLLVGAEASDTRKVEAASYVWKHSPSSVTRRDNAAYGLNSVREHIEAVTLAFELIETKHPEKMCFLTADFFMFYYFDLHQRLWELPENKARFHETEAFFIDKAGCYKKYLNEAPGGLMADLYRQHQGALRTDFNAAETMGEWLKRLAFTEAEL
jgi:glycosyltransferase involved in cell wall biosynthesis